MTEARETNVNRDALKKPKFRFCSKHAKNGYHKDIKQIFIILCFNPLINKKK